MYCYTIEKVEPQDGTIITNRCEYYSHIVIKNVYIPFCLKLGKGDVSSVTDSEFKLIKESVSSSILKEVFCLNLLHDGVAECGKEWKEK